MHYVNLDKHAVRTFPIFASSCFRVFAISLIACASNCATLNLGYTQNRPKGLHSKLTVVYYLGDAGMASARKHNNLPTGKPEASGSVAARIAGLFRFSGAGNRRTI